MEDMNHFKYFGRILIRILQEEDQDKDRRRQGGIHEEWDATDNQT